jgi:hypothetical protein
MISYLSYDHVLIRLQDGVPGFRFLQIGDALFLAFVQVARHCNAKQNI